MHAIKGRRGQVVWHNREGRATGGEGNNTFACLWPGTVDQMHTGTEGS